MINRFAAVPAPNFGVLRVFEPLKASGQRLRCRGAHFRKNEFIEFVLDHFEWRSVTFRPRVSNKAFSRSREQFEVHTTLPKVLHASREEVCIISEKAVFLVDPWTARAGRESIRCVVTSPRRLIRRD